MPMTQLAYTVRFETPAFLGNADQAGQWRTPPFKALLRQWWRVVYAADYQHNVDLAAMRREEGRLFGHAWLDDDRDERGRPVAARKSGIRLRLDTWDAGKLRSWPASDPRVSHPEVANGVGSQLYLGYGPLVFRNGMALKANAAIQSGEIATLALAVPDQAVPAISKALWLIDRFGALGGRSRNGWGSVSLAPVQGTPRLEGDSGSWLRPWRDALGFDWPHAVGADDEGRPLVWVTVNAYDDWKELVRDLAIIKIGIRKNFRFTLDAAAGDTQTARGIKHGRPQRRHWLSYPVTNHSISPNHRQGTWPASARLPNTLRFKVRPDADDAKKLRGVVFHVPCRPPAEFAPERTTIESVWAKVHGLLDQFGAVTLERIAE